jgi:peptidoglycan/xylan/chitin deacetylase (PgdA/CDA1 family)
MGDRLVLAYHAVSEEWPAALSIPPERLDRQLGMLAELGYEATSFTEAVTALRTRKVLAVTFDDAFRSVIEHGLPILSRYGFVATVFVATDYIGRQGPLDWPNLDRWIGGPHESELTPMSWDDLRVLVQAGWEIGSHTCSHPHLTSLDDDRLSEELVTSRHTCELKLGAACTSIAYPYGDVNRRVMAAARRSGYLAGAALPARIHRAHRFSWPRVGIWQRDPERVFQAKLSRIGRRRLDLRTGVIRPLPRWRLGTP